MCSQNLFKQRVLFQSRHPQELWLFTSGSLWVHILTLTLDTNISSHLTVGLSHLAVLINKMQFIGLGRSLFDPCPDNKITCEVKWIISSSCGSHISMSWYSDPLILKIVLNKSFSLKNNFDKSIKSQSWFNFKF